MNDFTEDRERLIKETGSDQNYGLSDEQVEKNRLEFGANKLTGKKPETVWHRILEAIRDPMLLMLIAAEIIALGVNIFHAATGGNADFMECVGVFMAIALSVTISVVMEGKSAKAFEALSRMGDNVTIKVLRGGKIILINQQDIVVGDIMLLSTGDKIPADARLLYTNSLAVNESALTGESVPVNKNAELEISDPKTPLAERFNMIYSGTFVTGGNCKALVTATGDNTEFGRIARALSTAEKTATPLQEKLGKLGKFITIIGVAAAIIVFVAEIIGYALHDGLLFEEVLDAFITAIVLIVAAVPEGLPTIVAIALSINIIKLSKQNALIKKMIASETIGCINVICSDKTGTLTENKMTVKAFFDGQWQGDAESFNDVAFAYNICLNSTADLGDDGSFIGNPTECALLNMYEHSRLRKSVNLNYSEQRKSHRILHIIPFSSEEKHMTTVALIDGVKTVFVKGSPESILSMCDISEEDRIKAEENIVAAQEKAMRVIAFAHRPLEDGFDYSAESNHKELESRLIFDGFAAIADPLRADVYDAVQKCRQAGISLKILTGDNIVTARAIAEELELLKDGGIAVEAKDIAEMSDEELIKKLPEICVIARSTPTIKMRVVNLLKGQGNVVAVTGDGINDAPALKNADVGIAMGISGTEVSKEASDIVLLNDSFATIVKAVEWGRNIFENFKRFISFQLTVNVASVLVVLVSILIGLEAPFTALELLWINIIMDGPPALTLGLEPNYDDLMKRKPTGRSESILTKPMIIRIFATGIFISLIILTQYAFNFLGVREEETGTVLFTLFVLFQLFNAFNCRELHSQSIFRHLTKNKPMLIAMGATFALQIIIIQFAGAFFGTVPLGIITWLKIIALALSVVVLSELVKLAIRLAAKCKKRA